MEEAEKELERRSKFLNSLIQNKNKKKSTEQQEQKQEKEQEQEHYDKNNVKLNNSIHVKACDMSLPLQKHAFQFARDHLDSIPTKKPDSKHLALSLKKEFDSSYGPAWHCIVGTSFGSYVTHSVGGFVYFSIDKPIGLGKIATFINAGKIDSSELITMKTLKDAGVLGKQIKDGVRLMGRGSEKIQWPIHLEVCIL